jgi:hypothetical protein
MRSAAGPARVSFPSGLPRYDPAGLKAYSDIGRRSALEGRAGNAASFQRRDGKDRLPETGETAKLGA